MSVVSLKGCIIKCIERLRIGVLPSCEGMKEGIDPTKPGTANSVVMC